MRAPPLTPSRKSLGGQDQQSNREFLLPPLLDVLLPSASGAGGSAIPDQYYRQQQPGRADLLAAGRGEVGPKGPETSHLPSSRDWERRTAGGTGCRAAFHRGTAPQPTAGKVSRLQALDTLTRRVCAVRWSRLEGLGAAQKGAQEPGDRAAYGSSTGQVCTAAAGPAGWPGRRRGRANT